jgi:hypothetical protein
MAEKTYEIDKERKITLPILSIPKMPIFITEYNNPEIITSDAT